MGFTEITTAITSAIAIARETAGIAKGLSELGDNTGVREKLTDFLARITDLQIKLSAAYSKAEEQAEIARNLAQKMREREDWDDKLTRYELIAFPSGCVVYSLRSEVEPKQPHHYLCPTCVQQRQGLMLQPSSADSNKYVCDKCGFEATVEKPPKAGPSVARVGGRNVVDEMSRHFAPPR